MSSVDIAMLLLVKKPRGYRSRPGFGEAGEGYLRFRLRHPRKPLKKVSTHRKGYQRAGLGRRYCRTLTC